MRHLTCLLLLLATPVAAQPASAAKRAELKSVASADAKPRPTFPRLPLTLRKERPANAGDLPQLSAAGRYATVRAGGKDLVCGFDAMGGSFALGKLHVGAKPAVTGRAQALRQGGFRVEFHEVSVGGTKLNFWLEYKGTQLVDGACEPAHHRRGSVVLEGAVREVILVDADGDGRYNGDEDRWIALLSDRTRRFTSLHKPAMSRVGEPQVPFEENGTAFTVRDVAADGSSLRLVRGKPTMPLDQVLARRYEEFRADHFRQFRREKASFLKRVPIDAKRPQTRSAVVWPRIPLEEAKERARKTGRPLLVAFYTETNAWWWRYVYYTFPDREVDQLLRKFVLTAVDAEKGGIAAFQKSGAKSLPALQAFSPAGKPIAFRFRSRDKQGKARDLEVTTAGATGWLVPRDLVVNLKRMLQAAER